MYRFLIAISLIAASCEAAQPETRSETLIAKLTREYLEACNPKKGQTNCNKQAFKQKLEYEKHLAEKKMITPVLFVDEVLVAQEENVKSNIFAARHFLNKNKQSNTAPAFKLLNPPKKQVSNRRRRN